MIRFLDVLFSFFGLLVLFPVLCVLTIVGYLSSGSPIFLQERVGRNKKKFILIKFRTMKKDTESVASHLADSESITKFGKFLRKTKLDELPQLWNVLKGDMSLVGPRPCLFNQEELIDERERLGVFVVRPGITGLAQINNIDMSTPKLLAKTDASMISKMNFTKYFYFIWLTAIGKGSGDGIL
ncbi:sugar transferase [Neptuniibacter sp. QD48_11]|uniref:sugar transferase n=1 Tax=unclassified Neptuniibacter TaxID=2630693 RepID=UPI0039F53642